jgi:hypothetical protein
MFQHPELPSPIQFVHGNWESFSFDGFHTILASHVFEHLYSPRTCIENLQKANVSEIFLSIPNFEQLLYEQSPIVINSQHTFYCGVSYIVYMFSLFKYTCAKHVSYKGNLPSNMFHFVLDKDTHTTELPSTNVQLYKDVYVRNIDRIQMLQIPKNCYIAPSGIYGQFLYFFLHTTQKEHIVGFVDNNPERHRKVLYGTDKRVYSPSKIDIRNVAVLVCDCAYTQEIIKGLRNICETVRLYVLPNQTSTISTVEEIS